MFRRRLSLVLILLAATLVLQGVGAVFALREAERQVVRGRIASDIHLGFVQLSATKQRLRSWVTQQKIGAGGELAERDALLQDMKTTLADLARLTEEARQTRLGTTGETEHLARLEALRVLDVTVQALGASIGNERVATRRTRAPGLGRAHRGFRTLRWPGPAPVHHPKHHARNDRRPARAHGR